MTSAQFPSKSQQAYQWMRDRITSREFAPGFRLVLTTVAADLNMSVVPVREALRQLEAEGLVTFERNVGASVSMVDDLDYRSSMYTLALLEGAATASAAPFVTAADIARARDLNARMRELLNDFDCEVFMRLNHDFHMTIFERTDNPRLLELLRAELSRVGHARATLFHLIPERAYESVEEHDQLLELIEQQAPMARIETVARAHRTRTFDMFAEREAAQ